MVWKAGGVLEIERRKAEGSKAEGRKAGMKEALGFCGGLIKRIKRRGKNGLPIDFGDALPVHRVVQYSTSAKGWIHVENQLPLLPH